MGTAARLEGAARSLGLMWRTNAEQKAQRRPRHPSSGPRCHSWSLLRNLHPFQGVRSASALPQLRQRFCAEATTPPKPQKRHVFCAQPMPGPEGGVAAAGAAGAGGVMGTGAGRTGKACVATHAPGFVYDCSRELPSPIIPHPMIRTCVCEIEKSGVRTPEDGKLWTLETVRVGWNRKKLFDTRSLSGLSS